MKKSKILVTVLIALMMAVGFGAAGINTARANDGGEPADTGKLLYYVDVGSAVGADWATDYDKIEDTKTLTEYDRDIGVVLATSADTSESVLNSVKEQQLAADSISGKEWGVIETLKGKGGTGASEEGYDSMRYSESGPINFVFEVEDSVTPLRLTLGFYEPGWGGRAMKVSVNGVEKVASYAIAQNKVYNLAIEGVTGAAGTGSVVGNQTGRNYVKVKLEQAATGAPIINKIFLETMTHSTNLYGASSTAFIANQIVRQGADMAVLLSDTPTTVNVEGEKLELELSPETIASINSAKPFTKVSVAGTYSGDEYSGSIYAFPRTMEYFVNVGSQNGYEQAIVDELYPALRNNGSMDKQWANTAPAWGYTSGKSGGGSWTTDTFDKSIRSGSAIEYGFTLANPSSTYSIYWGTVENWWDSGGSGRTGILTISNIEGGNRNLGFHPLDSRYAPAHYITSGIKASSNTNASHLTLAFNRDGSNDIVVSYIAIVETNNILNLNGGSFIDEEEGTEITFEHMQIGDIPSEIWGELPDPVKKGYSFDGWYTDDVTFLNEADFDEPVTRTTAFYAKWVANNYNVTFHSNNGKNRTLTQSITFDASENLTDFDDLVIADPDFDFDNCTFLGWAATATGAVAYNNEASYTMTEEGADLYAVWDGDTCTVTLDYDGGTPDISDTTSGEITVDYGAYITGLPGDPSLDYHDFAGWFTQAGGQGTEYENGDQWLEEGATATLYAHYTPKSYPVNFTLNGGTLSATPPAEYTYGTGIVTLPVPSRSGYQFLGWCKINGNIATKVESVGTAEFGVITLYALWQEDAYAVNYTLNGGNLPAGYAETYTYGTGISALAQPTRAGYSFGGWFDNAGLTGSPVTAISSTSTGEVNLYAKWIGDEIEITLNLQNGSLPSGTSNTLVTEFGAAISGLPVPTRSGYDFAGWYTQAGGQGTKYSDGDISDFAANATLYAHWTIKSYTVTFDSQGGSAVQNAAVNHNAFATKPADPTREGYTFGGWYTNAECTEEWVFDFDKVTSDKTLYAKWTQNSTGGGKNCGTIGAAGGTSFPTGTILIATALFFLGLIVLRRPGLKKSK